MPFGGIYRIVDFTLSNCLNSGLRRILVLTQYKAMSLDRHITLGWRNYLCRELGEFIDVVPPQQRIDEQWYQGTADAVYQNIYTLEKERPEYVVILAGDHIYKMDYSKLVDFHQENDADVTIAALRVKAKEAARQFGIMQVDSDSRVIGFEEKPAEPKTIPGDPEYCLASMGIYVFNAHVLVRRAVPGRHAARQRARLRPEHHPVDDSQPPRVWRFRFSTRTASGTRTGATSARSTLLSGQHRADGGRAAAQPVRRPLAGPHVSAESAAAEVRVQVGRPLRRGVRQHRLRRGDHLRRPGDADDRRAANPRQQLRRGRGFDLFSRVNIGRQAKIRRAIIDKGVSIPEGFRVGFDEEEDQARGFIVSPGGVVVIAKAESIEPLMAEICL